MWRKSFDELRGFLVSLNLLWFDYDVTNTSWRVRIQTHAFCQPPVLSESLALCMAYNWQASKVAANEIAIFTVRRRGGRRLTTHLINGNKQSKVEDTLKRKDKRRDTFVDRWQQISTGNVNEFSEPLEISSSSKLAGSLSSYF